MNISDVPWICRIMTNINSLFSWMHDLILEAVEKNASFGLVHAQANSLPFAFIESSWKLSQAYSRVIKHFRIFGLIFYIKHIWSTYSYLIIR